jgi:gluconolactonase
MIAAREETQHNENSKCPNNSQSCGWRPATHYPDPAIQALDPRFEKILAKAVGGGAARHGIALGRRAGVVRRRRYLLCSDIPNQRISNGRKKPARSASSKTVEFANGNTRDRQGRLITASMAAPRRPHRI